MIDRDDPENFAEIEIMIVEKHFNRKAIACNRGTQPHKAIATKALSLIKVLQQRHIYMDVLPSLRSLPLQEKYAIENKKTSQKYTVN